MECRLAHGTTPGVCALYSRRSVWQKKHEIPLAYRSFEEVVCGEGMRQVGELIVIKPCGLVVWEWVSERSFTFGSKFIHRSRALDGRDILLSSTDTAIIRLRKITNINDSQSLSGGLSVKMLSCCLNFYTPNTHALGKTVSVKWRLDAGGAAYGDLSCIHFNRRIL